MLYSGLEVLWSSGVSSEEGLIQECYVLCLPAVYSFAGILCSISAFVFVRCYLR